MPASMPCSPSVESTARAVARYDIDDRFTLAPDPPPQHAVEVWCPLIQDTPYQRVVNVTIAAPGPWTIGRDADHGNLILHACLVGPLPADPTFQVRYTVERRPVPHMLDPACVRPLETPALFQRSLQAEQYVDITDTTRRLAREVVAGEGNALEQARRLYEHVVGTMSYNAAEQSWKGSTEHALTCSVGNCNDIHALFISLCRSLRIPAQLVLGQAFEAPTPGQEVCELCGYHCWAEFFVAGLGWLPADASCACKYGKNHLFGELEMNHIAWSVGRDILLAPPQRGGRVLFFAGPYAEADGLPCGSIQRRILFTELE